MKFAPRAGVISAAGKARRRACLHRCCISYLFSIQLRFDYILLRAHKAHSGWCHDLPISRDYWDNFQCLKNPINGCVSVLDFVARCSCQVIEHPICRSIVS